MAGWGGWAGLGEQCIRYVPCERLAETEATLRALSGNGGTSHLRMLTLRYRGPTVLRLLYDRPEHRGVWYPQRVLGPIPHGHRALSGCPEWGAVKATGSRGSWEAKYWCTCFWAERTKLFSRTENTSARALVFSLCLRGLLLGNQPSL